MGGALNLVIGLAGSVGAGVLLWFVARATRSAPRGTRLSNDGIASALSLAMVACLVVVLAWSVKGAMELVSEPLIGAIVGIVASLIAVFLPLKLFGRLPAG
ncbi:MAG: hypothetical protein R3D44_08670 [Hyphomicrobiaceae bacterium]